MIQKPTVIFMISGAGVVERMGKVGYAASERGEVYRLTSEAIVAAPMPGTGYRTFPDAFTALRTEPLLAPFLHGHNMYLEETLELGVMGAAVLLVILGWLGILCLVAGRRMGREAAMPCVGLAALALVAVHSCTDSTLRIPAVAIR